MSLRLNWKTSMLWVNANHDARPRTDDKMTLEQMRTLVDSSQTVRFSIEGREAFYNLVSRVLKHHGFTRLSREHKGIVRRFLVKVTGRSRAQITRLIGQ